MSSIDERVVELQFNNGQFEKGVSQSVGTLEKLKRSLNLEASANSLSSLERVGKNFSLSNVANNIQTVADRVSALGIIGDQVLRRLTDKAISFGSSLLTAVPKQIVSGGKKRAQNIKQAMFQMEGLLGEEQFEKQWEDIKKDINYGVDSTAYGFDAAAKVAAQLTASNISFGTEMQTALRGISGVAAMTNSSYEEIGHIFTTIAGQGKVMSEQLNQFAYRGLNVAATLADYLKTDEATLRTMVTKGEVDFKTFATAMNEAFGKQATKANKTFDGAMSNIRASLSRMGEGFATPAYEAIRQLLVGPDIEKTGGLLAILKDIEGILKPIADSFSVFTETSTAALTKVLDAVHAVLEPYGKAGRELHDIFENSKKAAKATVEQADAAKDTATANSKTTKTTKALTTAEVKTEKQLNKSALAFSGATNSANGLIDVYNEMREAELNAASTEETVLTVRDKTFQSLERIGQNVAERIPLFGKLLGLEKDESDTVKGTAKEYEGLDELAKDVILGKYGNGEERRKKLEELGYSYAIIQNRVNELLGCEKRWEVTAEDEAKMAKKLGESNAEAGEGTEKAKTNLEKLALVVAGMSSALSLLHDIASAFWTQILQPFASWAGIKIFNAILTLLSNIGEKLVALRAAIPADYFDNAFGSVADTFRKIGDSFGEFLDKVGELESVKALTEAFTDLGTAITEFFNSGVTAISGIFLDIGDAAEKGIDFDWALPIIDEVAGVLTTAVNAIAAAIRAIWPILFDFGKSIKDLFKILKDSGATQKLVESFGNLGKSIGKLAEAGFGKITEFFSDLGNKGEEGGHKLDWLAKVVDTVSNALSWFADKVSWVIGLVTDFVTTNFTSENFTKFKDSITDFITKVKDSQPIKDLMGAFSSLASSIEKLFNPGKSLDDVSRSIGDAGDAAEVAGPKFDWLLKIVEGLSTILTVIVGWADSGIQKLIEFFAKEENAATLEKLSQSFNEFKDAVSGVIGLAFGNLVSFISGIGKKGEEAKEGIDLTETVSTFEKVSNGIMLVVGSITELLNLIIENGGNLNAAFKAWLDGVDFKQLWADFRTNLISAFAEIFGGKSSGEDSVVARGPIGVLDGVAEGIEEESKTLPQMIAGKLVSLPGEISKSIKELMSNVDTKGVFEGIKITGIGVLGLSVGNFFRILAGGIKSFAKLPKSILKMFEGLKGVLTAYQNDLNATALLKCAAAIGIFVLSLWGLSKIDPKALASVLGVMTPLIVALGGLIFVIEKMKAANKVAEQAGGLAKAITPLGQFASAVQSFLGKIALGVNIALVAGGLVLLANSLMKLSTMEWPRVLWAAAIMVGIAAYLGIFTAAMKKITKDMDAGSDASLFFMAAAITALAGAMYILGGMDLPRLVKGGFAVAAMMMTLAGAARLAGDSAQHMGKFGAGLILVAVGLTALLVPLHLLAMIMDDWDKIKFYGKGLLLMGGILAGFAILAKWAGPEMRKFGLALQRISESMLKMALAVVIFSASIALIGVAVDIFVRAMVDIGKVVGENIGAFIGGVAVFIVSMGLFITTLIALSAVGSVVGPGLAALGMPLLMIAGACAIIVGSILALAAVFHFFPEFGDVIANFVGGAISALGELVSHIPLVGEALSKLFGGKTEGETIAAKIAIEYDLSEEEKNKLATKIDELLNFEGTNEEFTAKLGELKATVDALDLPDKQKAKILQDLCTEIAEDAKKDAQVKFDEIECTINKLKLSNEEKADLVSDIQDLANENLSKEEKQTKIDQITATIDGWVATGAMTYAEGKSLKDAVQGYVDSADNAKTATIELCKVMVEGFDVDSDKKQTLMKMIDELLGINDAGEFERKINEIRLYCNEVGIDDPTTELLLSTAEDIGDKFVTTVRDRVKEGLKEDFTGGVLEATDAGLSGVKGNTMLEKLLQKSLGDPKKFAELTREALREGEWLDPSGLIGMIVPPEGVDTDELWSRIFPNGLGSGKFEEIANNFDAEGFLSIFEDSEVFKDAGKNLVDGVATGMTDNTALVEGASDTVADAANTELEDKEGISSPSRVWMKYGGYLMQGLANGITRNTVLAQGAIRVMAVRMLNAFVQFLPKFKTSGMNSAKAIVEGFKSKNNDAQSAGSSLGEAFANGIKSKGSQVKASAAVLANNAVKGLTDRLGTGDGDGTKGYKIGKDFGQGLINGLNSKIAKIKQKAAEAGAAMDEGAKSKGGADEASPSKKAIKIGKYFGEGLVIGMNEYGKKVYTASADMANSAVDALRNPMSIVKDILSGDLEVDPTIRPVMDLSEIQNGVNTINAMSPAMAVGIGSISASMNRRKVDTNEEVIAAIQSLKEGMDRPSNTYNVNGVTYDDGSNVSDAVRGLIRAARIERRR